MPHLATHSRATSRWGGCHRYSLPPDPTNKSDHMMTESKTQKLAIIIVSFWSFECNHILLIIRIHNIFLSPLSSSLSSHFHCFLIIIARYILIILVVIFFQWSCHPRSRSHIDPRKHADQLPERRNLVEKRVLSKVGDCTVSACAEKLNPQKDDCQMSGKTTRPQYTF